MVILIIILIIWLIASPSTFLIGLLIIVTLGIIINNVEKSKKEKAQEEKVIVDKENETIFQLKKQELNIDSYNVNVVNYKKGFAKISKSEQYIWIKDGILHLFPAVAQNAPYEYILFKISMKDIEYFSTQGEISSHTKISGGGGVVGGNSMKGAIVGGVIAGGAGAVIGSRKKGVIEPIKSEIVKQDDRETFINYFVGGEKHSMFFDFNNYTTLLKIMPEKDYNNVVNKAIKKGSNTSSIAEDIKSLSELKEKGILTDKEFDEKKKILLDKIK
ncbi:hypothetical protein KPL39_01980 [Clostridium gasigenes]|uniref:hypothetical protein n=1 Tax=Clostridium gasigenes TaxID=94869 RepID=UPI001C0B6DAD|nr:hypothetical protein [Clostridium gasigenes]MBU3135029.1 hypothetical protein [Clostridium gasigenes]